MAKARKVKKGFKFGVEVPTTVERALAIDRETNTDLWAKAIEKEMLHVFPAFKILDEGQDASLMSKYIRCHMIFYLKLDLTHKAHFVAGGHMTDPPTSLTYSSVVTRDSMRLAFLIAALNELDVLTADIGNAYLNADTKEKVHTICGLEFGNQYIGRIAVIHKALYGSLWVIVTHLPICRPVQRKHIRVGWRQNSRCITGKNLRYMFTLITF